MVFVVVPTPIRLARLRAREIARYGQQAIAAGGEFHEAHLQFLEWAGRYDTGGLEMRSRALHEAWLGALPGAVVRLEGDRSVGEQLAQIEVVRPLEMVLEASMDAGLPTLARSRRATPAADTAR